MTGYVPLESCLACGAASLSLVPYLDLGDQPLANEYTETKMERPRYPLGLAYCETCFHSQNLWAVDRDLIFRDAYSGGSPALAQFFEDFVDFVEGDFENIFHPLRVLEIGSNDGALLKEFRKSGHKIQGVDPARNLVVTAIAAAVPTLSEYWSDAALDTILNPLNGFDVVVAMNVLDRVTDPLNFLVVARRALAPDGRIYITTSSVFMQRYCEFDLCSHERLSFFTVRSFCALAERAGMKIERIDPVKVNGMSYLLVLRPMETGEPVARAADFGVGQDEEGLGYYQPGLYRRFGASADVSAESIRSTIDLLCRSKSATVVMYGADIRAMTMLNYTRIVPDLVFDDSPLKHGRYSSCGAMVVQPADRLKELPGVALFLLPPGTARDVTKAMIKAQRPDHDDRFLTWLPIMVFEA